MIQGLYSAATALDTLSQNQDVVAQNLAHASMPGYRRRGLTFEAFAPAAAQPPQGNSTPNLQGTQVAQLYSQFDAGPVQYTGNPLDMALKGNGFFTVDGPNGPLYTRNGTFQLGQQGQLQNSGGLPVAGTGGPITIPPTTSKITITQQGAVFADKTEVGRLQLTKFANPGLLKPAGTTLFQAPPGVEPQPATSSSVQQGYREGSNVQVVSEMASMIAGMRQYEAAQRALRSLSEAVQQNVRPSGN